MQALLIPALLLFQAAPVEDDLARGVALAREGRFAEAREALEAGWRAAPDDKRFPREMAGLAFRQKQFGAAKKYLRAALRLDPEDPYAAEFLGTLFLLDGNQEAALQYWNRAGRPRVREIRMEPEPQVDPVLLDRAFAFSPAAVLKLEEYRVTRARLELLGVFPLWKIELLPGEGDDFEAVFRSSERRAWWLSLARGAAFQTVHPEFYNLRGSGTNFVSLVRWDAQKRRVFAALSGPVARDPGRRRSFFVDARNENWNVPGLGGFNLQKVEGGAGLDWIVNSRWGWGMSVGAGTRRYRNSTLQGGVSLWSEARVRYGLLRVPERRLTVVSGASWRVGRTFERSLGLFSQGQASLEARWFPRARGEDFATAARVRVGSTLGEVPFDSLYMLGLERDNDLWLRAHIGSKNGQKGSAPMGRSFVLTNWELDKLVCSVGFVSISLGPFVDSGRAYATAPLGSSKWLWDAGAQAKVRVAGGFTAVFSYGKDLHTGRGAFYVTLAP